jgi:glycosyltransferase involved in cell wall biosynthesis
MISVIIPAHNEEAVIARGLRAIIAGAQPGELEVIVACNGCTDRTAAIARSFGPPVRVLEVPVASKIAALNAADEVARSFPRVYLDADVRLDIMSVRRLAAALDAGDGVLLAAPRLRMDLRPAPWLVRAYYEIWMRLPYNASGMVGTGVYALSKAGRQRFDRFPDLIADDGFVRFCFSPEERVRVDDAYSWVDPPQSLWGLIKIKTRSRLGFYQHRQALPQRRAADHKSAAGLLRTFLPHPRLWPLLPLYVGISLFVRLRAARQLRAAGAARWERDDSRQAAARQY